MQMKDGDGQIQGKVRKCCTVGERAREIAFLEKILIATEPRMVFNVMLVTQLWGIVSRWVKYMRKNPSTVGVSSRGQQCLVQSPRRAHKRLVSTPWEALQWSPFHSTHRTPLHLMRN